MARVRTRMDRAALNRLLKQPGGPVYDKVVERTLTRTEAIATATGPRITSHLVNKHFTEISAGSGSLTGRLVYDADYVLYVIKGTGIYGPHGTPIVPKTKKYLKFKGSNGVVYARSVQGQKPNPFLANAFIAGAAPWPVTIH